MLERDRINFPLRVWGLRSAGVVWRLDRGVYFPQAVENGYTYTNRFQPPKTAFAVQKSGRDL
jgi:hypothetical protein